VAEIAAVISNGAANYLPYQQYSGAAAGNNPAENVVHLQRRWLMHQARLGHTLEMSERKELCP
jgi:hypothetical protein